MTTFKPLHSENASTIWHSAPTFWITRCTDHSNRL